MPMTLTSKAANSGVVTGNVPAEGGTRFLRPRLPAIPSIGTITRKRPTNVANPIVKLYQCVFAFRPANADPLLPAAEVNGYSSPDNACRPALAMLDVPEEGATDEIPVRTRIVSGKINIASMASCTS